MEIDARVLADDTLLEAEVCVVGGGPAGLTVAREIARAGISVLLMESGGWSSDAGLQRLNEATSSGDRYAGLQATRHRQLGGTAQTWNTPVGRGVGDGAKYAPLDSFDLDGRGELPGWPMPFDELEPYYRRAQTVCELGPFRYQGTDWAAPAHLLAADDDRLTTRVYQFGTGRWCRETLPRELAADPRVTLCLNATVTRLVVAGSSRRVTEAVARTGNGASIRARARNFVLAGGAVENARLLLHSEGYGSGLGNQTDWVGRCFMEHPRDTSAVLVPQSPRLLERVVFYDGRPTSAGVIVAGRLALGERLAREEDLPNASVTLLPRRRPRPGWRRWWDRWRRPGVAAGAAGAAGETEGYGWSATDDADSRIGSFQLLINVEQRPRPDNRITLGSDRDSMGVPLPHLHWVWSQADQAGLDRVRRVVKAELEASGHGRVEIDWEARPDPNAHHHAGTTRMAAIPAEGVVDRDGLVFGTDNLFVAGASVFPTAGFANPVLTIVAMAIRLGEHLAGRSGDPPAASLGTAT